MGQLELIKGVSQTPHANRGRQLEGMLIRTHQFYERSGIASVEKIPNAFVFCNEIEWQRIKSPALKARTADGKPLKREKTDCDFKGHARGFGVAFDAKEFSGASIPLTNFKPHQVLRLFTFARTGGCAGFMIWAKRIDSIFWIEARAFNPVYLLGQLRSLNLAWLKEHATLICQSTTGALIDWASVLFPQVPKAS